MMASCLCCLLLLLPALFWTRVDAQCTPKPCYSKQPSDPTYAIQGRDIKLDWQWDHTAALSFQKWSILKADAVTIDLNILTNSPTQGLKPAAEYIGRVSYESNSAIVLKNISVADERHYECTVNFADGKAIVSKMFLNVTVLPSVTTQLPSQKVLKEGNNATLFCDAEARPPPVIVWYLNGAIVNTGRFSVKATTVGTFGDLTRIRSTLDIINVKPEDNGDLKCSVEIITANLSSTTALVVHYTPRNTAFTTNVVSNIVTTGGSANLTCTADGLPEVYYQIYKAGKLVQNSTRNYYTISSSTVDDEAIYHCTPRNYIGEGPTANISVLVRVPPTFLQKNSSTLPVLLDSSVSIVCVIYGEPKPIITWKRENSSLPSGAITSNRTISQNSTFTVIESKLFINKVAKADYGVYTCTGTNNAGVISHSTTLDVQFVPTVNTTLGLNHTLTQDSGKNASWTCTFEGNPQVNISWLLNDKKIDGGGFLIENIVLVSSPKYVRIQSKLTMTGINHEKSGFLTCNGVNSAGNVGQTTKVIIKYIPMFDKPLPVRLNASEGTNVSLACNATGNPQPVIVWMKEGRALNTGRYSTIFTVRSSNDFRSLVSSKLQVRDLVKSDHGVYICSAGNSAGSSQQNTTLHVQYIPYFLESPQPLYNINDGTSNFQLVCHYRAKPAGTVVWYKDGQLLRTSMNVTITTSIISANETGTEARSIVTFPTVQKNHFGHYRCNVSNEQGKISASSQLIINYPPFFTNMEPLSHTINVTRNITFTCEVQSSPISNVTWITKHSNGSLPSHYIVETTTISTNTQFSIVRSTLHIFNTQNTDFGDISCKFQNHIGQIQRDYVLAVYYPPSNTTGFPLHIIVDEGQSHTFTTTFIGYPKPIVNWFINDTKVSAVPKETSVTSTNEIKVTSQLTLSPVSRTSVGLYSCRTMNLLGEDRVETTLVVHYPPSFLQMLAPTLVHQETETAVLSCSIISNPESNTTWLLDNRIETNSSMKTIINKINYKGLYYITKTTTLEIKSLTKSNSGNYSCQARNKLGTNKQTTELIVYYAPEIIPDFKENINISETNSLYMLECTIEASPAPNVYWTRNNVLYTKNVTTITLENLRHRTKIKTTISFSKGIKRTDHGFYSCHSDNKIANKTKSTNISVWYIPEFLITPPKRENRTISQNVSVLCEIQGHPPPTITWFKDGKLLSTGFTTSIKSQQATNAVLTSTLLIPSVNKINTGSYVCRGSNIAGHREMATYVDVQYLPQASFTKKNVTVNDTQPITLDCSIDANPPIHKYEWRKNGALLSSETKSKLTIMVATKTSTGVYTCKPINAIGEGPEITYDVKVKVKPEVTKPVACTLTERENGSRVYECICGGTGYPMPTIRWTKFGSPNVLASGPFLNVSVQRGIDGTYECRIRNSQGEVVNSIQIIVFNDQYGSWSAFTPCNTTCGGGIQTRTRPCNIAPCSEALSETRSCNIGACGAIVGEKKDDLLFLYVLIPIVLFLLIFIIIWLARINRNKEDQEPIVVPINGNLSKPPSVRSLPTKREIYLPENNFGVLNAGYRPDGDAPDGPFKKERDTIEVEMHFGNEPLESDTDPVEIAVPATESPDNHVPYANGITPSMDMPDTPDYIPVPDYDFVQPRPQTERPFEVESWLGPEKVHNRRQREDEGDFYTAL